MQAQSIFPVDFAIVITVAVLLVQGVIRRSVSPHVRARGHLTHELRLYFEECERIEEKHCGSVAHCVEKGRQKLEKPKAASPLKRLFGCHDVHA